MRRIAEQIILILEASCINFKQRNQPLNISISFTQENNLPL